MEKRLLNTTYALIILALLSLQNTLGKPLRKEVITILLNTQTDSNLQEAKQFIGSSVIGGLMWPVLLTLTFTAIMARVPDVLQRLLTGTGGNYRYINSRRKRSERDKNLDEIMKNLLTSLDVIEKFNSEEKFQKNNRIITFIPKLLKHL